ncbi:helix-turn-helix domain-containing protein [Vagococcus lutrae]|uniref:helix-turn-helix domain-containing protein n=1 Tax=Vagococcus lutrae TaxID=81947 RepID=UPI00288E3DA8|nr:helix-turn-helix domain-containing protein [Vagococcus lutrae]MDT2811919.1 helix-turn-helix domain-containing protein [Vagococcus lutrae]
MYNQTIVKSLTNLPLFINSKLVTNQYSLYNPFNNITIMDTRDIVSWLNEYEILIIGNYFKKGFISDSFIQQLAEKKLAAIITKRKFEPYISDEVFEACDHYNIALIICEDQYSWTNIQTPVLELITTRQLTYLKENYDFYQIVINSINNDYYSNNLCNHIYYVADLSLAILNHDCSFIDYSENIEWHDYLTDFQPSDKQMIGKFSNDEAFFGYIHSNKQLANDHLKLFVYPFLSINNSQQYLLILTPDYLKQLEPRVLEKMNTVISIYSLRNSFLRQSIKSSFYANNLTYQELVAGKLSKNKEHHLLAMLECQPESQFYLITCAYSMHEETTDIHRAIDFYAYFKDHNLYAKSIHFFTKDTILAFLVEDSLNPMDHMVTYVNKLVSDYFTPHHFKIGVSKVHSLKDTYKSWHESKDALYFLFNTNSKKDIKKYQDLGILNIFINNKGELNDFLCKEMIDTYIQPLLTYDQKNHTDLLNTLIIFFSLNCSYKETSEHLFLHVNSLRSRIATIEKILNIDITNTDDKFNLYTALKIYQSDI